MNYAMAISSVSLIAESSKLTAFSKLFQILIFMKSIIHTNTYKVMRITAGFFLLFTAFQSFAQPVNNQIKDVTMPAPNAAALGKYGDYSVGTFTGVPDINVPIYTVQEGSLSLPIL